MPRLRRSAKISGRVPAAHLRRIQGWRAALARRPFTLHCTQPGRLRRSSWVAIKEGRHLAASPSTPRPLRALRASLAFSVNSRKRELTTHSRKNPISSNFSSIRKFLAAPPCGGSGCRELSQPCGLSQPFGLPSLPPPRPPCGWALRASLADPKWRCFPQLQQALSLIRVSTRSFLWTSGRNRLPLWSFMAPSGRRLRGLLICGKQRCRGVRFAGLPAYAGSAWLRRRLGAGAKCGLDRRQGLAPALDADRV